MPLHWLCTQCSPWSVQRPTRPVRHSSAHAIWCWHFTSFTASPEPNPRRPQTLTGPKVSPCHCVVFRKCRFIVSSPPASSLLLRPLPALVYLLWAASKVPLRADRRHAHHLAGGREYIEQRRAKLGACPQHGPYSQCDSAQFLRADSSLWISPTHHEQCLKHHKWSSLDSRLH